MNEEYKIEQLRTQYLEENGVYDAMLNDSHRLATTRDEQLKGIDLVSSIYGNIDNKFHAYESHQQYGDLCFIELDNPQHSAYENDWTQQKEDEKKETDYILYICLSSDNAYLLYYGKASSLALKIKASGAKLTKVKTGTRGLIVPISWLKDHDVITKKFTYKGLSNMCLKAVGAQSYEHNTKSCLDNFFRYISHSEDVVDEKWKALIN